MHLRATETKPKASIAERAVRHFDLLGNNRELLGVVPLISIFKREQNDPDRVASRQVEKRQESTRGRPYRKPAIFNRQNIRLCRLRPSAVVSHSRHRYRQSLRGPIPVAADATATLQPGPSPSVRSPLAVACPRARAIRPEIRACHANSRLFLYSRSFRPFRLLFRRGETGHRVNGDSRIRMSIMGSGRPPKARRLVLESDP